MKEDHPFARRDVGELTDREWRVLASWRLEQVEKKVDGLMKAAWSIVGAIVVGVVVYALTTGTIGTG